ANGSVREKVSFDHIPVRLIDVGQKARVEINRGHCSSRTDYLREPSRYGAPSCTDLTASPTFTNPKLHKRTPSNRVEELFQDGWAVPFALVFAVGCKVSLLPHCLAPVQQDRSYHVPIRCWHKADFLSDVA